MHKNELTAAELRAYRLLAHVAREVELIVKRKKKRTKTKAEHRQEVKSC